ncbi:MAG TPA: prolipoprotein diacylglyceryl transferase [Chloroflexi bacterium]|nr:prolipoprotein diacylglyceryl transferase [Chloroflexota bacterium]
MTPPVDPVLIQIGPFAVHWYGVLILTGVLLGAVYATRQAPRHGIDPDHIWNGLTLAVILGIIGARLYHVFSTPAGCTPETGYACGWPWYRNHPEDIVKIWQGGLGIYGAIIGGALGIILYARAYKLSIPTLLDLGAPGLALGQAIGRWGNFINQELYGPPTGSSWFGLRIDAEHRLPIYKDLPPDTLFHPTFLYESLWCLALFIVLATIARKLERRLYPGDVFAAYLIGYPLGRFWIEFFRPDAWKIGPLATAQWVALLLIVLSGAYLVIRHRWGKRQAAVQGEAGEEGVEA